VKLCVDFEFSASHLLEGHSAGCAQLHGHNYVLEVEVSGGVDPGTGLLVDFEEIDRIVGERVLSVVDHRHLNDFLQIPTAEVMLEWFWRLLAGHLPLSAIRLHETRRYVATYHGEGGVEVRYAEGYEGPPPR
jgi:6-pyruvoyltetrahydropterin/6-carboxytetrahydropterin synthase